MQARLYKFNITKDLKCSFCSKDVWFLFETLVNQLSVLPVDITQDMVIFLIISLIMLNMVKSIIWDARCQVRFEHKV